MRIYKFRGFHADEHGETVIKLDGKEIRGRWYKGDLSTDGGYYIQEHSVLPETVGQYIGLDDKNGKEIFEGDIVVVTDAYDNKVTYIVEYKPTAFCVSQLGVNYSTYLGDFDSGKYEIEIIGNIHNNPELLEAAE